MQDVHVRCHGLLVVTMLVIAGCGSKDSNTTTTANAPATTSTTTSAKTADEPNGKLSAEEYQAVRLTFKQLTKLEHVKSLGPAIRITNKGCVPLTVRTELVARIKRVCSQSARTLRALHALDAQKRDCMQALNAGDVSCYSNLFRTIGRAVRVSGVREREMNAEIRRRELKGDCADTLSSSKKELASVEAMTHDAISAANAAERRDGEAFVRATNRLQADINADTGEESARQSLRKLKTCV